MQVIALKPHPVQYKIRNSIITDIEHLLYETVYDKNGHEWVVEDDCGGGQYLVTTLHGDKNYVFEPAGE